MVTVDMCAPILYATHWFSFLSYILTVILSNMCCD